MQNISKSLLLLLVILNCSLYAQWTKRNDKGFYSLKVMENNIYAAADSGVYLSVNSGADWILLRNGMGSPYPAIQNIVLSGSSIFVTSYYFGVYVSTDNGKNWTNRNNGLILKQQNPLSYNGWDYYNAYSIISTAEYLFVGLSGGGGIYRSSNDGYDWVPVNSGLPTNQYGWKPSIKTMFVSGSNIFAGTMTKGIFVSSDGGNTWNAANNGIGYRFGGDYYPEIHCFAPIGQDIFVGTWDNGVYQSGDNGTTWNVVNYGLNNKLVYDLTVNENNLIASTWDGVYVSTNKGVSWKSKSEGLTLALSDIEILDQKMIGIGWSTFGGFWESNIDYFTPVESAQYNTPTHYYLGQNYPNPFNPTTIIEYGIPKRSRVNVSVFDALGRRVKTLVNKEQNSGKYIVTLDASELSSGIYLCKITAGNFNQTKKMILVK